MMIYDYATGRKFSPVERLLFAGAARDERLAGVMEAFGTRNIGPLRMMAAGLPLAVLATARRAISADGRATPALTSASAADGGGASEGAR
jgi:hypothetical protein